MYQQQKNNMKEENKHFYKVVGSVTDENKKSLRLEKNQVMKILPDGKCLVVEIQGTEFEMDLEFLQTTENDDWMKNQLLKHSIAVLKYTPYLEIEKLKII